MLRIALVDDDPNDLASIKNEFEQMQEQNGVAFQILEYTSGEAFLDAFDGSFDLVFMDVERGGGMDGFAVAKEMRQKDNQVILVFVTRMAQLAIRGYAVRALDFLVKPVSSASFALKAGSAVGLAQSRKKKHIVVTTSEGVEKFESDEVAFVETDGHYLCFHTKRGVFRHKGTMKALQKELADLPFRLCNQSFLVNLSQVRSIRGDDVLAGDEWIRMSRPRKKSFLRELADYMGGALR